jgi:hypothetical protein
MPKRDKRGSIVEYEFDVVLLQYASDIDFNCKAM